MQADPLEDGPKRRDRDGFRFLIGVLVLALILGAACGALLIQPAPVRFAGWTFIGPNNQQEFVLSSTTLRTAGRRPNSWVTVTSSTLSFPAQWKPTPKLQVLSPRVYHYGFCTLIQQ